MNTTHIVLGVVALLVLLPPRQRAHAPLVSQHGYLADSTTWGADQWARLYGADLMATDAQSPLLAHGVTSCRCTGFNA